MSKKLTEQDLINFEDSVVDLYFQNKLPFLFHLSGGNEKELVEIFKDIKPGDYVLSNHRNHYHAIMHGIPEDTVRDRILNGRSMFIFDRERNFFTSAIIGGLPAIAAGIAWALKRKKSKQRVWCFLGDGNEDSGHLHEAARYVDGWDLPCNFVVEDNRRSVDTPTIDRWGSALEPSHPKCVQRYVYEPKYPHARTPGMIDLSKATKLTDDEYFPVLEDEDIKLPEDKFKGSYKDAVNESMDSLGADKNTIFIGYNVLYGNAMGNLENVPDDQKLETPVAENLMAGLAIGMSFEGFKPVVYYERHDFMLVAADAIGNHMNYIERISHGEFKTPITLRTVVADGGPFYSGPTHSQDFTSTFREMVTFPIFDPETPQEVMDAYNYARLSSRPVMVVERKSRF
jgi:pyruvate dehydrogenase E1 component alpha subunit|tara:strand:+ start:836 stop:2032 length:1197 start_codon:yes stop_codon:yes gene_type:complete